LFNSTRLELFNFSQFSEEPLFVLAELSLNVVGLSRVSMIDLTLLFPESLVLVAELGDILGGCSLIVSHGSQDLS